jgi:uncharacterized membrane protein YfcA
MEKLKRVIILTFLCLVAVQCHGHGEQGWKAGIFDVAEEKIAVADHQKAELSHMIAEEHQMDQSELNHIAEETAEVNAKLHPAAPKATEMTNTDIATVAASKTKTKTKASGKTQLFGTSAASMKGMDKDIVKTGLAEGKGILPPNPDGHPIAPMLASNPPAAPKSKGVSHEHGEESKKPPPITDFKWYHGLGLVLAMLGLILAAGGGIGGGGLLVPIFIIVMKFSEQYGIPLSNVTILGGALANNAFNMVKRHPNTNVDRPMIDYDLVMLMEPPTIAGAVIGSILNKVLPEFAICSLLVLVLGATAIKTWTTGTKARAKEVAKLEAEKGEESPLVGSETKDELMPPSGGNAGDDDEHNHTASAIASAHAATNLYFGGDSTNQSSDEYKELLQSEADWLPLWKVGAITFCLLLVMACNITKLQALTCGTAGYWVMMMVPVVITMSFCFFVRRYLLRKGELRRAVGAPRIEGDVEWNDRTTIIYPLICTLAGLFAGMFGIGGGIVKGPLMLEMGVLPEVSAATAAFMILYTSATATVTYAAFGNIAYDWAALLFSIGFIFTCVGQEMVNNYIARTGRKSIIVFIIAVIVGLSTLLMGYESGVLSYHDYNDGTLTKMGDVCAAPGSK